MQRIIPFLMCVTLLVACGGGPAAALALDAPLAAQTAAPTVAPTNLPTVATTASTVATNLPTVTTTAPTSAPTSASTLSTSSPVATVQTNSHPTATQAAIAPPAQRYADNESPTAAASAPIRIAIPAIALNTRIVSVGLDKDRVPIVPNHDVGWYNLSAMPGQGENVVLWGHVLRFRNAPTVPAPFARIKELKPGALITLYDAQGVAHQYRVTKQLQVKPNQVEYILPQGKELLTLVSCIGASVVVRGEVVDKTHRLITIAEPVSS